LNLLRNVEYENLIPIRILPAIGQTDEGRQGD
jgi:hypothetical protein